MTSAAQAPAAETVSEIGSRLVGEYDNPSDLATAMVEEIGWEPQAMRSALIEVMPSFAGAIIANHRNAVLADIPATDEVPADAPVKTKKKKKQTKGNPSKKVTLIVSWFENFLATNMFTGEGWKKMGDFTYDDLLGAVSTRRDQAHGLNKRADQYEALAKTMQACGAETVADVPETDVQAIFNGEVSP